LISVYLIDLDNPVLSTRNCFECLDAAEKAKAIAYRRDCLKRRFVASHFALRVILGRVVGKRPSDMEFRANSWGRPELLGGPFFNISHSEHIGVVAVDPCAPVGIDVEILDERYQLDELTSFLSARERSMVEDDDLTPESLTRIWVRKEALLKAFGQGLSYPLSDVSVDVGPPDYENWRSVAFSKNTEADQFELIDLYLTSNSVAALASANPHPCVHLRELQFSAWQK